MSKWAQTTLLIFSALCLVGGAILALGPTLERTAILERQSNLLISIAQGNGEMVIPVAHGLYAQDGEVDFYARDAEAYPMERGISQGAWELPGTTGPGDDPKLEEQTATLQGIGILTIEAIDARLPVVSGVRPSDLKVALGHVPDTPEIGERGNAVIAGHRNYTYGDFLNRLDEVRIGDTILYENMEGEVFSFEVYEIRIVDPGDPVVFDNTAFPSVTLLTCTPVRIATHRLIVRAGLTDHPAMPTETPQTTP